MVAMQKELLDAYEEIHRAWLARVKSEADLWSDMANKMQDARSVPNALTAYPQCVTRKMQLAIEHGRRLLNDGERLLSIVSTMRRGAAPNRQEESKAIKTQG